MANYQVKVTADTKAAAKDLTRIDRQLANLVKPRQLSLNLPNYGKFRKNIGSVSKSAKDAANDVKTFYNVARQVPGTREPLRKLEEGITGVGNAAVKTTQLIKENNTTTKALTNTAKAAGSQFNDLITKFAKMGLVLYGITTSVDILKTAFGGLFNETIGRAAKFNQTLLKTQTTLASTNRVFQNGTEITDPLEKITALTGEIGDRVESIRQRSIDLAGVTSNDVVEVFGMVASQISQINGNLEDAEDLAIQFAAALGTFGIPLYQARQEIGSILRGDITVDSYLAKALGITNEDVQKAKDTTDGVVGYLNKKLAAAVAGQTIAAKGLEGVLSNIRDIYELIAQAIGEPLLDPFVAATSAIYDILFKSKDLLMDIGNSIGEIAAKAGTALMGAFQMDADGAAPFLDAITKQAPAAFQALQGDIDGFAQLVSDTLVRAGDAIRTLFTSIAALTGTAVKAFRELLGALIDISLLKFESLLSAMATIAQGITPILQGLTEMVKLWADILRMPIVQYFSQIAVTFAVLKATGVIALAAIVTQLILWSAKWKMIIAKVKAGGGIIAGVIKTIASLLGSIIILLGKLAAALKQVAIDQGADKETINAFKNLEKELNKVGRNAKGVAYNFRSLGAMMRAAGRSAGVMALNFIKANAVIIAVTVGITLAVDAWGRYTRAQEEARQKMRNNQAMDEYIDNIGKLSRELTIAEEKQRDFAIQAANTTYDNAIAAIRKYEAEIKKLKQELGTQGRGDGAAWRVNMDLQAIEELENKIKEKKMEVEKALQVLRIQNAKDEIRTLANERKGLEKEIIEVRRQLEKDLFQAQQQVRRKELEVFRAQVEIMLLGIRKRNRELIKGEEGASRKALEAYNQYIEQKKRGEMDLEAQKKQLTIEILNLEQAAIDYRYGVEKKIAELRRRVASNDVKQAQAAYEASTGESGAGVGNATFGKTGRSINAEGWVHGHFQTNTGSIADLINDVTPVIMQLAQKGVPMYLADNTKIDLELASKDRSYVQRMLGVARAQHGHSGDGRSIDIFVPEGTKVPVPLGDVANSGGNGGVIGTLPGTGRSWVGHLTPNSKSGAAAAAQDLESLDIPDPEAQAQAYETQNQKVQDLTRSLIDLSSQANDMRNEAAFAELFEQAFPKADMEALESQLKRIQTEAKAVLETGKGLRLDEGLQSQYMQQKGDLTREFDQTRQGVMNSKDDDAATKEAAITKLNELEKERLKSLEDEFRIRQQIRSAQEAMNAAIQQTQAEQELVNELAELQLKNRLEMEGFNAGQIAYEIRKMRLIKNTEKLIEKQPELAEEYNAALQRQLGLVDQIFKTQQAAANPLKQLYSQWKEELKDVDGYYAQMAQTVQTELGNAMSQAIIGVIDGTSTVQEAFANMFKNIGQAFIQMATQMIAKALIMKALGILFPGAAFPASPIGSQGNPFGNVPGVSFPGGPAVGGGRIPLNAAEGGFIETPQKAIVAEAGEPEYIIPQSKMDSAMSRWNSGTRGAGVLDPVTEGGADGSAYAMDGGYNPTINITGGIVNMGGEDYIKRSELPSIVGQAAKSGEERALRKLRMSPSARRKIGI